MSRLNLPSMDDVVTEVVARVNPKAEGLREEYTWYHLREMFPGAPDALLTVFADRVLWITGY